MYERCVWWYVFLVIFMYAEHEVRMCLTVNEDLQWSQLGDCSSLCRQEKSARLIRSIFSNSSDETGYFTPVAWLFIRIMTLNNLHGTKYLFFFKTVATQYFHAEYEVEWFYCKHSAFKITLSLHYWYVVELCSRSDNSHEAKLNNKHRQTTTMNATVTWATHIQTNTHRFNGHISTWTWPGRLPSVFLVHLFQTVHPLMHPPRHPY